MTVSQETDHPIPHIILGTAGHIDHGKTTLVRALTGIDTDRWEEEKSRGMTIDIGFAYLDLPDVGRIGIIDVPGHERFVKNMLAGSGGIDIGLLVVDASEGIMPQTREHLDILHLLGVQIGLVAITKVDLADDVLIQTTEEEIRELIKRTALAGARLIRVSAVSGDGIDDLKEAIAGAATRVQPRSAEGLFRLPVDRVFPIKGFGTVITGTVFSGRVAKGDSVQVFPGGAAARVRRVEVHDEETEHAEAGQRTALNLAGSSELNLSRGSVLVSPGTAGPTEQIDVRLHYSSRARTPLKTGSDVKFFLATNRAVARVRLLGVNSLAPGKSAFARLRLSAPLLPFWGDHFIIRGGSPETTVGGGRVLELFPEGKRPASERNLEWLAQLEEADPRSRVIGACQRLRKPLSLSTIAKQLTRVLDDIKPVVQAAVEEGGLTQIETAGEQMIWSQKQFQEFKDRIVGFLERYFSKHRHELTISRESLNQQVAADIALPWFDRALKELAAGEKLQVDEAKVALPGRAADLSPNEKKVRDEVERLCRENPFSPPTLFELGQQFTTHRRIVEAMCRLLVEEGRLVLVAQGLYFHTDALADMKKKVLAHFAKQDQLSVSQLKGMLGVSRKFTIPLIEFLDKTGLTFRSGDIRKLKKKG